jgi:hypothetical protein
MGIPFEKRFHFRDGSSVGSLEELREKIETVSYQEFYHHVNADKNDFANWIQHVMNNERLATDLRHVTSIVETVEIINDHLHPRPVAAPQTDLQSQIEKSVLDAPLPAETDDHVVIEQMPLAPAPQHLPKEDIDFRIIEERIGLRESPNASPVRSDPVPTPIEEAAPKVRDELFGHPPGPVRPQPRIVEHDPNTTKLILRDGIIGFLIGIVVGWILGRII